MYNKYPSFEGNRHLMHSQKRNHLAEEVVNKKRAIVRRVGEEIVEKNRRLGW